MNILTNKLLIINIIEMSIGRLSVAIETTASSVASKKNGRGGENRTPIKSFGDSYATIIPRP